MQENLIEEKSPLAVVNGEPLAILPDDLYIPPDALRVFLETFSGPLDLLLYLYQKTKHQHFRYSNCENYFAIHGIYRTDEAVHLELAAEYLVMAAMLAEIKSRLLLPRPDATDQDEDDPR